VDNAQRFPLSWPAGWARTARGLRRKAAFRSHGQPVSIAVAIDRLDGELERLRASHVTISTNVELTSRGTPRSGAPEPADPGAAVYFTLKEQPRCLACDTWTRLADNLAAIAQHIDAIRRIDRYGVGTLDQAFAGYTALPERTASNWRRVLEELTGMGPSVWTLDQVDAVYKALARRLHPDTGGTHEAMARLTGAVAEARQELGGPR
jgi:hypothetical protein